MSSTHCFLRTENRSIRHGVVRSEFVISHTSQRKRYISIVRTGNFIMYALGPFSRKRSQILNLNDLLKGSDIKRTSMRTVLLKGRSARTIQLPLRYLKEVGIRRYIHL